jgi:rhodanese-related sulfurtransferase
MTKEELKTQLDSPDIVILDVRTGGDWKTSEFKIKGAVRANPQEFDKWADVYPKNKKLVLYCA